MIELSLGFENEKRHGEDIGLDSEIFYAFIVCLVHSESQLIKIGLANVDNIHALEVDQNLKVKRRTHLLLELLELSINDKFSRSNFKVGYYQT